jgi:hypothetical protein
MLGNEERRVKAMHEVTQYYERSNVVTRRELSRADMIIEGEPSVAREEASSEDDDVEDETYVPLPRAQPHGWGNGIASGSGAAEIEEEGCGDEGEEEEEIFDVEEINPPSYIDIDHLGFRTPTNPIWRVRVSYKGKTGSVRENKRILPHTQTRDVYDYRFHSLFQ